MKKIPTILSQAYLRRLSDSCVPKGQVPHYLKWLRYYLNFCFKYELPPRNAGNLPSFLLKLADKGQSKGLQLQAKDAVKAYYAVVKDWPEKRPMEEGVDDGRLPDPVLDVWAATLSCLRAEIKLRQYSRKTMTSYCGWVCRFKDFCGDRPVDEISADTAKDFLTELAVRHKVAASTQNQAFHALLFLFRYVLKRDYELGDTVVRAKTSKYIPTVLTREEVGSVIKRLTPPYDLIVSVLYGCGLRLTECLNLRVNNLDFDNNLVIIHDGKGKKDRSVPMPQKLKTALRAQIAAVYSRWKLDLEQEAFGGVFLPDPIAKKSKQAAVDYHWQWLFPAKNLTLVPDEGVYRRYHCHDSHVGQAIRSAIRKAAIPKRVTAHTFRHTFASHLLQANLDLRTIQQLLGHSDIRTTMIYTHTVQSRTLKELVSPLDLG